MGDSMSEWNNRLGNPLQPGDYIDPETGLHRCRVCNEYKETFFEIPGVPGSKKVVMCACQCTREQDAMRREVLERQRTEYERSRRRTECFGDDLKKSCHIFEADDKRNEKLARQVRGYVQQFAKFKQEGRGLLLLGPTGTGKTFYACCIANALIDAGYSALVTNFAKISNDLQGTFDKARVHNRLLRADLLVLDDLATERDTSFMQEIVFQVVEERSAAQKPMIVTSNVSTQEFMNSGDLARRRVFSRLKEVCIPLAVTGTDRREELMCKQAASDQALLDEAGAHSEI